MPSDYDLDLYLHDFPIPQSLRIRTGTWQSPIKVKLHDLLTHMYWDSYGIAPPNPNPFINLYTPLTTTDTYLRFTGTGLGDDPEIKRFESCRFGRAFCRWFLHNHVGTTHFTSLNKVLKKEIITGSSIELQRVRDGNAPDYICHSPQDPRNFMSIYFAEAKGKYKSLNFNPKGSFEDWRRQVKNVEYVSTITGRTYYSKGYIVATRFTNQSHPKTKPAIWAEDPNSSGETPFTPDTSDGFVDIQRMIKTCHYAPIMERLELSEIATALMQNQLLPRDQRFRISLWQGTANSIAGRRFIGGFIPFTNLTTSLEAPNAAALGDSRTLFVGLDLKIFYLLRQITLRGREAADDLFDFTISGDSEEDLTLLRDGTVIGPLNYFEFDENVADDLDFFGIGDE